jgi:hypothetical protein
MRALSKGSIERTKASAARSSRSKFGFMLPLRSSSITTVMGWMSLAKRVSVCRLPSSSTAKSPAVRSGTRRPWALVTVA